MALWGDVKLFFCSILVACFCREALAQIPMDCCLSVVNKTVGRQMIVDYQQQSREKGCNIDATILVTRRCRKLCIPADEPWVQGLMKHVDHRKKTCHTEKHKKKHCACVKRG